MKRADSATLLVGALYVLVAILGGWAAYRPLDWASVSAVLPLSLLFIGLGGLWTSRRG